MASDQKDSDKSCSICYKEVCKVDDIWCIMKISSAESPGVNLETESTGEVNVERETDVNVSQPPPLVPISTHSASIVKNKTSTKGKIKIIK